MSHKYRCIEITFPVNVEIDNKYFQQIDEILTKIAADYEKENPGRIMWPFGHGFKMLIHPMMIEDDKPIPFDESTYSIEMSEREAYVGERNHVKRN